MHWYSEEAVWNQIQKNIIKLLDKGFDIFEIYKKYRSNWCVKEELDFIIEDIQDNVEELYMDKLNDYITNLELWKRMEIYSTAK